MAEFFHFFHFFLRFLKSYLQHLARPPLKQRALPVAFRTSLEPKFRIYNATLSRSFVILLDSLNIRPQLGTRAAWTTNLHNYRIEY